ncbi:hypothetical protein Tsubulata_040162 [Turnera subulata]|uniref:Uncharacterized protein n=1 Tax=Turnera subulata TaxID=218843 RepID=A0A9Q0F821_9ROSI|nr:hypothetical protein Tsubulata_040162 [Turnera subulata]
MSSALSWFFWFVSRNPHVEKNISREELTATLPPAVHQSTATARPRGRECRLFDVEVLKRLPYLHGALCESLRLYPPVPFEHKSPSTPDILPSGHRVNPGMKIFISLYSMGRMVSIWGNDCLEFKPERWITNGGGIKHEPSYKFLAFNAGPRACIGKNIAFLQLKAVAAAIIYNYTVQLSLGFLKTALTEVFLTQKLAQLYDQLLFPVIVNAAALLYGCLQKIGNLQLMLDMAQTIFAPDELEPVTYVTKPDSPNAHQQSAKLQSFDSMISGLKSGNLGTKGIIPNIAQLVIVKTGDLEMIVAVLIIACIFVIQRMISGIRNYDGGLPRNWPLVGMLPALLLQLHRIHDWWTEILEKSHSRTFLFKGLWSSNMESMDWVLTADPSNVHYIMSSNFSNFPKGCEFKEFFDILGDSIFSTDSDLWKSQRKLAVELISRPLFYKFQVKASREKVEKGLIPVLEHASQQGLVVDMQDLFGRLTFDTTCLILTGHDTGCLSISFPEVAFTNAVADAEEAIFYRHILPRSIWKLQRWLNIGEEKKLKRAWQTIDGFIGEIISAKKEELSQKKEIDDGQGIDLLASYMMEDLTVMGWKSLDVDKFLRDTIFSLMVAGQDTVSSTLSWFFWLVLRNPHVEKNIRDELKATLPVANQSTSRPRGQECRLFDDVEVLKRLPYLHGALCETLRLYPPAPLEHKSPVTPDILPSGHRVNPKKKIYISLYAMGRMTSIWGNDCMEFKPERWITNDGGIKHEPSYKFLAFNAGPRTCLGKNIAFFQMKAAAAAIIYNYTVQLVPGQTITPSLTIVLGMKHGMKVNNSSTPLLPDIDAESSQKKTYYLCPAVCYVTNVSDKICPSCGLTMDTVTDFLGPEKSADKNPNGDGADGGYVTGPVTYMVTGDLSIAPMSMISVVTLLNKFNIKDFAALEEKVVEVGIAEGLELLKAALVSKSPLTEVFVTQKVAQDASTSASYGK